jgi:hypothetical protein
MISTRILKKHDSGPHIPTGNTSPGSTVRLYYKDKRIYIPASHGKAPLGHGNQRPVPCKRKKHLLHHLHAVYEIHYLQEYILILSSPIFL